MVLKYALIGAVIALVPGASVLLIPMEVYMVYQIAAKNNSFEFVPFMVMSAALVTISGSLKGLVTLLHGILVLGQIINAGVAFGFIMAVGFVAEKYYARP